MELFSVYVNGKFICYVYFIPADLQFPIDLSNVAKDHPFLENDPLQSLYRRLVALNRCATMRLDGAHKHGSTVSIEKKIEPNCTLTFCWSTKNIVVYIHNTRIISIYIRCMQSIKYRSARIRNPLPNVKFRSRQFFFRTTKINNPVSANGIRSLKSVHSI